MIQWVKALVDGFFHGWNKFWFDSRSDGELVPLALFRLTFCTVMFVCYCTRIPDIEFFYGFRGILPLWHAETIEFVRFHPTLIRDTWPTSWIQGLHFLFLFALLMQAVGLFTRPMAVLTYVLHLTFLNRNMGVMFGVDMIATFFLLYLCFANSNARFSIDAWRKKGATRQSSVSHLAYRLMQLQVCIIYGFSGMEKLKGTRWWDGSALWDVLSIGNMQRFDLSFVAHFPVLLAAAVYVVLAWEVYFPVLIWVPRLRLPMLVFGFLMHIGIYVFMNLPSFGFMMITLYILFLTKEEVLTGLRAMARSLRISRPIHN